MRVPMRTIRTMIRLWAVLVALGLTLLLTLSAQLAWRTIAARRAASLASVAPAGRPAVDMLRHAGLTTGDSGAPARGVTGTIALPAVPLSGAALAAAMRADAGTAAPFTMAAASGLDRSRALACLTAAIYYEAASESDAGQSAVAQVILNRARHPAFPATVCGVVYQGSDQAGCQFSFACDGAMARVPVRAAWARAARHAAMALAGYVYAPVGLATHYHTYAVTPAWNRAMVMTDMVGAHLFHRWKGFWGTRAAFAQRYRGGEPEPGPHPRPAVPPLETTLIAAAAPLPVAPVATAVAAQPVAAVVATDTLPPASTVLDKWKDSGKPLF